MGILDWLLPGSVSPETTPDVETGIERLIQIIDPRLKALSRLERKLGPAIEQGLTFCKEIVDKLPGPLDAGLESWQESPQLKALFTRSDELQQIFSRQAEIQEFVAEHPGCEYLYLLLGARLEEKQGFGVALSGETLQHDIAITTLNFSHHRLYIPQDSESRFQHALTWGLFDQLAMELLKDLTQMKEQRAALQEEIALLRTHLSQLQRQGLGEVFSSEGDDENNISPTVRLSTRIREREATLANTRRQLLTLDDSLDWIVESLSKPDNLIDIDQRHYRINSVNQQIGPEESGTDLHLIHASITAPTSRQGVLFKVRYSCRDLIPKTVLDKEIDRLYG